MLSETWKMCQSYSYCLPTFAARAAPRCSEYNSSGTSESAPPEREVRTEGARHQQVKLPFDLLIAFDVISASWPAAQLKIRRTTWPYGRPRGVGRGRGVGVFLGVAVAIGVAGAVAIAAACAHMKISIEAVGTPVLS